MIELCCKVCVKDAVKITQAIEEVREKAKVLEEVLDCAPCDCAGELPITNHDKLCFNLQAKKALEEYRKIK